MKKIRVSSIICLLIVLISIQLVPAPLDSLGVFEQDTQVRISQVCNNANYITVSSVTYPNSSTALTDTNMTYLAGGEFYIDFNDTRQTGRYDVRGISDGCENTFATYFEIESPINPEVNEIAVVILLLGMGALNYWYFYRRNRFLGNMVFMSLGLGIVFFFIRAGEDILIYMGVVVAIGSIINMIFDLIR